MPLDSIIAKFTTPLTSRNKNISDFHIEPDDPWRTYSPGDTVSGTVTLTVVKPVRITHLVICLHGHAKVFKTQVASGEGYADAGFLGPGRGRRGFEYHGNGFMSLFEDEIVLCGEGRLKEGIYKFKFDLEFPSKALPSSIDFERGVVCYNITATLTKPTTITPTMSCDRRIQFQDLIDIAPLPLPKPKAMSLEPVSKRGRAKHKVKTASLDQSRRNGAPSLSRTNTDTSMSPPSVQGIAPPLSPTPSEASRTSTATESSQSFRIVQQSSPSTAGNSIKSNDPRSSSSSVSESAIHATTELLAAGVLPGDHIPLKISIRHTKPVRGIAIFTIYRQGRIDMYPALPMGQRNKGKVPEYEDIYPKSRTGLGGLHLSSGSPSSVFRKDLAQTTAPMIINPHTLTAEIKASVRLPEDAFPTITNVPGAMITFKYYVEVVIDLCGKLGESRLIPRLSMTNTQKFEGERAYDQQQALTRNWGDRIIDTDPIRRIKTVVTVLFDVTVGSRDTARATRKLAEDEYYSGDYYEYDYGAEQSQNHYDHEWTEEEWRAYYGGDYEGYWHDQSQGGPWSPQPPVAPPDTDEPVDEKTRLKRAEELLLPSQPPQADGSTQAASTSAPTDGENLSPTAPYLGDEYGLYGYHGLHDGGQYVQSSRPLASAVSARSVDTIVPRIGGPREQLPPFESTSGSSYAQDDKQEMERQRLLAQASAPPAANGMGDAGESSTSARPDGVDAGPSAPMLTEEDEYQPLTDGAIPFANPGENLPQYRR